MRLSRFRPSCCCAKRIRILCELLERESCTKNERKSAGKFNALQPVTSMHRFLLNSVECMIFGFYNPASPAVAFRPCLGQVLFSEAGVYFGLVAVSGPRLSRSRITGRPKPWQAYRDWQRQRAAHRVPHSNPAQYAVRGTVTGRGPPRKTANKKNVKAGY